jgi:hypothetical protein
MCSNSSSPFWRKLVPKPFAGTGTGEQSLLGHTCQGIGIFYVSLLAKESHGLQDFPTDHSDLPQAHPFTMIKKKMFKTTQYLPHTPQSLIFEVIHSFILHLFFPSHMLGYH